MLLMVSLPTSGTFPKIKYVFLDRDGVTNRKLPEGQFVRYWRDFEFLRGAECAIATLNRSGRHIIVVTNQRGVALGLHTRADVDTLHLKMQDHLAEYDAHIDAFYYCPHDQNQCDC